MATVAQSGTPSTGGGFRSLRRLQAPFWIACLVILIAFPLVFTTPATTTVAFFTLVFAAAGAGWNIFSGYSGYIALGHAVFFGVGAYALALMCKAWHIPGGYEPFALVPLAGLAAAVVSLPLGYIALRTRRHTFIVITIAFLFIFQLMAYNLRNVTLGSAGIEYPIPLWSGSFFNLPFYYVMALILLITIGVSWFVRHSKYGLELLAIRDDEDRALGLGVRTTFIKLSAFALSAFFVAMCGAVWAYYIGSIYPNTGFDANFDVLVALMAFLGGLGTISGPLLGALIIIPAQQYFAVYFGQSGYYLVLYGLIFVVVILLLPQGIVPALSQFFRNRFGASVSTPVAPGPPPAVTQPTPGARGVVSAKQP